jgi:CBS domain containing-hemolysin-like protein
MEVIIIVLALAFSAFFSGMEIAYFTANRFRIELKNKQGQIGGRIMSAFVHRPAEFLGLILIGNNFALVVYGSVMSTLLQEPVRHWLGSTYATPSLELLAQSVLSTLVVLVLGEFLPKSLFALAADRLLLVLAVPMQMCYFLFFPLVKAVVYISRALLQLFGLSKNDERLIFGKQDLDYLLQDKSGQSEGAGAESATELEYLQNALSFTEVKVRTCMVPRTELVAVAVTESPDRLRKLFAESEHSKILVYEGTIDHITGYVHFQSMLGIVPDTASITLPIPIVPETKPAMELLREFNVHRKSIALVVDEFGVTSGIVTVEDLIEEIFGEIEDEHDSEDLIEQNNGDGEYLFSARLEVDYLNEQYELGLPVGDYTTLGGLILEYETDIPEVNKEIDLPGFRCIVLKVNRTRIELVRLIRAIPE